MQFIGIDLHTNKFTCCYRDENSPPDGRMDGRLTETFDLNSNDLAAFYKTLTPETYVLVEATNPTFAFVRLIPAVGTGNNRCKYIRIEANKLWLEKDRQD
jgi:hypothetical protein